MMISSLSGGGAESVCVNIANTFVKKGWQVDLLILNLNDEAYFKYLSDKVNLVILNVNHARYSIFPLISYIFKNKIKTVLIFNYELTVIFVILRLILRLKINIISRNINTLSFKIKKFEQQSFWTKYVVKTLIKYFYTKTDHVINQCKAMQKDLILYFPNFKHNSSIIYNPLPIHIIDYVKNYDLKQINKENYLLCVGRLEKQKAFHYAIEAFAGISDKFPDLRLKIVGKGSLENDLRQKARDCSVSSKVDFEGFQSNILPYYLYAKATLLTSYYEGYPNVLIESLALNTPVISFDCPGGPSEIIQDGINGFLVNYLDIEDLKHKISFMIEHNFDYRKLKTSMEKNQIKKIFKQYEDLVNSFS